MDVNTILDTLISSANNDQSTLNDLIAWLQGQTLVSDNPNQTPPDVDEEGVWTLSQPTANSGVDFEGVYKLPAADACGRLEIISIVAHETPASGAPARIKGCVTETEPNPTFTDQASVSALDGQCFNAFAIRSGVAFNVQVRVTECLDEWCIVRLNGGGIEDLTLESGGHNTTATYNSQYDRYEGNWNGGSYQSRTIRLNIIFSQETTITYLRMVTDTLNEGVTPFVQEIYTRDAGGNWNLYQTGSGADGIQTVLAENLNHVCYGIYWATQSKSDSGGGYHYLTNIQVRGTGANPFGASNCPE